MIIKINNYDEGIHLIALEKKAIELNLQEPFFGDVQVECKMDKSTSQIVLNCSLSVKANLICDRCTKYFEQTLLNRFQLTYIFSREEKMVDTDNVYYIVHETDKINIAKDVRDYCLLSVPMKVLCNSNCNGLCPHCGTDLNYNKCSCEESKVNTIWEPLLKLKDKLN